MARPELPSKTAVGARLRELRRVLGDLDRDFMADKLGVSKTTLGNYEKGESEPTVSVLNSYYVNFSVNIFWIVTGEGEMFMSDQTSELSRETPELRRKAEAFHDIKQLIKKIHEGNELNLPSKRLDDMAIKALNAIDNDGVELADVNEVAAWLVLLGKRLQREINEARAAPGSGKLSAL